MDLAKILADKVRGCVLVTFGETMRFEQAYGYADLPNRVENTLSTKFATASAGKAFVAVGILQLIEEKRIGFEDTIGALLDMDWKAIDKSITVRQLLTHTSGIPDYFDESMMEEYDALWQDYPNYKIRTSGDIVPLFIDKPMMYPAGEKFQYNNTGYVVLGLIIESVTKRPFDTYLAEKVFEPCGMENTGYYELDRLPGNCANAYIYDEERGGYYTNIYSVDVKGTGAGGAFTTVLDIEKFWQGLAGGKLISRPMFDEMISPQGGEVYGYGLWLRTAGEKVVPYFQGCDPGVSFISLYDVEAKNMMTMVSNFGDDVWQLKEDILSRIGWGC